MTQTRQRYLRSMRLVRGSDFKRVYSQGSRAKGASLTVAVIQNGLAHSRLGLSVGKSAWKSAVRRNRIRRVFREAFRLSATQLPQGFDLVLIASTPKLEPQLEPLRRELEQLARKAARRYLEKLAQLELTAAALLAAERAAALAAAGPAHTDAPLAAEQDAASGAPCGPEVEPDS